MAKIKVRFKGYNPNSGYGFYQAGDVGTVVGYTQGLAVVVKEDGTFVKAELSHIVKMEEDTTQELEQEEQIKAGNWYVCNCEIMNENMIVAFHRDDVYFCPNDGWLDVNGALLKVGTICKEFRPATKEEIAHIEPIETEPIGVPVEKVKLATKQDTSELTEFEEILKTIVNSYAQPIGRKTEDVMTDRGARSAAKTLLSIARKQLQPEFDKELELAYKNQDEVVYNRGYDKGREDERKEKVDDLINKDDIEQLVDAYQYDGHPCDFQVKAYKQGIERVVEFIKEK